MTAAKSESPQPIQSIGQGLLDALEGIGYLVNIDGRIIALSNPAWGEFAQKNNAAVTLASGNVIGRPIMDFVDGAEVQKSYTSFMGYLTANPGEKIIIPFRCDSPTERRDMRLSISGVMVDKKQVGFLFVSTVLSTQSRPPLSLYDFPSMLAVMEKHRSLPTLRMCSYCQRVHAMGEGHDDESSEIWVEAFEYYRRGGTDAVQISHGICDRCYANIVEPQIGRDPADLPIH